MAEGEQRGAAKEHKGARKNSEGVRGSNGEQRGSKWTKQALVREHKASRVIKFEDQYIFRSAGICLELLCWFDTPLLLILLLILWFCFCDSNLRNIVSLKLDCAQGKPNHG